MHVSLEEHLTVGLGVELAYQDLEDTPENRLSVMDLILRMLHESLVRVQNDESLPLHEKIRYLRQASQMINAIEPVVDDLIERCKKEDTSS